MSRIYHFNGFMSIRITDQVINFTLCLTVITVALHIYLIRAIRFVKQQFQIQSIGNTVIVFATNRLTYMIKISSVISI